MFVFNILGEKSESLKRMNGFIITKYSLIREMEMKILAFSDWRVQDIEQFIDYLGRLEEKPDIIVYAGNIFMLVCFPQETINQREKFEKSLVPKSNGI